MDPENATRPAAPVAYVVGLHPALSHTFILHEVEALRRLGVGVQTISIREATGEHLLSERHRAAADTTYAVLPAGAGRLLGGHLRTFLRRPGRYLATLGLALRLSPPGLRGWLWQLFYFAEAMLVARRCKEVGVRHLHAHMANVPADVALLAAHYGGWTWSFTMHGSWELFGVERHRLPQKVRSAAFVACISDFTRSQLMTNVDERDWPKLHVVHCGLDPEEWTRQAPYPGGDEILVVGRLVPEKGYGLLLEALRGLDARLVVVGSGPKEADLRAAAQKVGVADRVNFTGAVGQDEIRPYYERAAVFCSPSLAEGIPFVLMEAMAMELPVVASRIAGIPELVEDGVAGVLVPPGRADLLAEALAAVLGNADREAMGRAGRARVVEEFDIAEAAAQLSRFFAEVEAA
jgi:glycosyltransferase involved in cell wall biosynthesis